MSVKQSQTARILDLLKTKGYATNTELNRICFRYSARLHELRKENHIVVTHRLSDSLFHYVYKGQRKLGSLETETGPQGQKQRKEQLSLLK